VAFERGAQGSGLERKDLCEWQTIYVSKLRGEMS